MLIVLLVIILAGLLWSVLSWLRLPKDLNSDSLQPLWPGALSSRWITVDGVRLHYLDQGEGLPVVLLHGFCASSYTWREVIEPLSQRFRVIVPDLKGFGLSEKPHGDYRLETQAHLIARMLESLNIQAAMLVGNSMGGAIAMALALDHAECVSGLILVDSAAFTISRRLHILRRLLAIPILSSVVTFLLYYSRRGLVRHMLSLCYYDPSKVTDQQRTVYHAPLATQLGGRASIWAGLAFDTTRIVRRASEITQPALLVWGETDRIIPMENARRLSSLLPNARMIVLGQCGHTPQEERPREFLEAILPFLMEHTAARMSPLPTTRPQRQQEIDDPS
ncbi:MAG: alpha/beta hydrolase [Acidobacteria bacterium]|nr:alpha/beta hydrolase [Acidobacteriota bacterium]MBI3656011.1 alpha/beta hydrolase [Acidobacteriota bacterium]